MGLFLFIGKYIRKNPKLVIYVNKKYQDFKKQAIHIENDIELQSSDTYYTLFNYNRFNIK